MVILLIRFDRADFILQDAVIYDTALNKSLLSKVLAKEIKYMFILQEKKQFRHFPTMVLPKINVGGKTNLYIL
jgi:hypothetical protein